MTVPTNETFAGEYPFEGHTLNLDGVRYHYVDEGSGPVLLFVHGNPTWSFAWRHLIKAFSPTHRCIAVDHVGCGRSDKPVDYPYTLDRHIANLKRLIEELDLHEIMLVGHDWGGCIGMGAAGDLPDRFARFVLMNTAAFRSRRIPWRIAVCRIPLFGAVAVRGLNGFARAALLMATESHGRLPRPVQRGYLAPYDSWNNRIATHEFVKDIPLSPSDRSYARLVEVERKLEQFRDAPMLLLWGMKDWCFTPAFLEEWKTRFPCASVHEIANANHYLFEDVPHELEDQIRAFLNRG